VVDAAADVAVNAAGVTTDEKERGDRCTSNSQPCSQTYILTTVEEQTMDAYKRTSIVLFLTTMIAADMGTTSTITTSAPI
jgi:hypothetical protein